MKASLSVMTCVVFLPLFANGLDVKTLEPSPLGVKKAFASPNPIKALNECLAPEGTIVQIAYSCSVAIKSLHFIDMGLLATVYNNRGGAYYADGNTKDAIQDYDNAINLNPAYPLALGNRGRVFFIEGDYLSAIEDFKQEVALTPGDAYATIWLFLAQSKLDPDGALKELSKGIPGINSKDWPKPVVELYAGSIDAESAWKSAQDPPEKSEGQACEALFFIGEYAILLAKQDKAVIIFRKAIEICPKGFVHRKGAEAELKQMEKAR